MLHFFIRETGMIGNDRPVLPGFHASELLIGTSMVRHCIIITVPYCLASLLSLPSRATDCYFIWVETSAEHFLASRLCKENPAGESITRPA